ncbi:MAG TPA: substrate-binding domain-containing protein [Polyangiaceae bacterium]
MGVALVGCSDEPVEPKPSVELAWISKGRCNSFFDIGRFGVRLAGQDLAAGGEADVHVELLEPDDCEGAAAPPPAPEGCETAAAQMATVEEAIAKPVDALAISVSNPTCLTPLLDRAVDQGIKVLTFDSDAPDSRRQVFYGMDNRAAGRLIARSLAGLLGGSGKVAIQTSMSKDAAGAYHLSTSTSYVERMAGIEEGLAEHPELTLSAVVPCIGNDVLDPACATELEALLEDDPEISGLLLARGKVLREADLAEHAPELTEGIEAGRLHAVAMDAPDDALANIRAGYAEFVIAQKQFGWGYDVMTLAYDMLMHGAEPPAFYDSGFYVVCPNNVDAYERMWEGHDFRDELEPCETLE